jgi:uncharacterized membrane protein
MATGQKKASKGADAASAAADTATDTTDTATETAQDVGQSAKEGGNGLLSELGGTARDAALAVLKPAVKNAAETAAKYAVDKGPDLIKDKLDAQGGLQDLADKALSNMGGVGKVASKLGVGGKLVEGAVGGDDEDGEASEAELDATGSGRRMPVQQAVDVAAPLETVYNQWTQFEEYPNFMFRVDGASQEDETHVTFTEKVWGFSREFEAEITEQRPYERIVWRSVNGLKHSGVVTFHELAERLTRVEVTVDFKPESLFQKFARGARFSKRAIRSDMHRFKAYVEMAEDEDGAWLGRVEEGEVVGYEEPEAEGQAEEGEEAQAEQEQPEAEEEEQPAAEEEAVEEEAEGEEESEAEEAEEEEPEAEEEQEPEAEEEQEPEADEDEAPARQAADGGQRRTAKRRAPKRPQRPARRRTGQQRRPTRARRATSADGAGQRRSSGAGQRRSRSTQRSTSGR